MKLTRKYYEIAFDACFAFGLIFTVCGVGNFGIDFSDIKNIVVEANLSFILLLTGLIGLKVNRFKENLASMKRNKGGTKK